MKLADLEKQRTAAVDRLDAAQKAQETARAAFLASGTPQNRQKYQDATKAMADAELDIERARTLFAQAEAADLAARRVALEAELSALTAELAGPDPEDTRLVTLEAEALATAATIRQQRWGALERRWQRESQLESVRAQLGHVPRMRFASDFHGPSGVPVSEILVGLARGLPSNNYRCRALHALAEAVKFT